MKFLLVTILWYGSGTNMNTTVYEGTEAGCKEAGRLTAIMIDTAKGLGGRDTSFVCIPVR